MTQDSKRPLSAKIRVVVLSIIGVAIIVFAIANIEKTMVNLLFARVEMPRFLLILTVFSMGAAAGWLSKARRKPKA